MIAYIEIGDSGMAYEKMLLLLRTYALDANELFNTQEIDELNRKAVEIIPTAILNYCFY